MGAIRFWYQDGQIIELQSSEHTLSKMLFDSGTGLHLIWRTSGTRIPFFTEQFDILHHLVKVYGLSVSPIYDDAFLKKEITRLLTRNRVFKGALVHLFLTPVKKSLTNTNLSLTILVENIENEKFILNLRGLRICGLTEQNITNHRLSALNNIPNPLRNIWQSELKSRNCDVAYFTDEHRRIVDSPDGSIFIIQGKEIITPSLTLGASHRALRKVILRLSPSLDLQINESENLLSKKLDSADEIFLANDQLGIRWIVGHGNKRYFRKYSELFTNIINREWADVD